MIQQANVQTLRISIHALREEGDRQGCCLTHIPSDFYPRPPRGGRPCASLLPYKPTNFYPRPPRGGRPLICADKLSYVLFLSTPSARRATHNGCSETPAAGNFYPRPPRGGRPVDFDVLFAFQCDFYPRPPRGGRPKSNIWSDEVAKFLSTPSARRATQLQQCPVELELISIHALREEGDSTTSAGGRK